MGREGLHERERELAAFDARLDRVGGGHGAVVTVEGDPGVGKTRLLAAARERAEAAGVPVLAARGSPVERILPFGLARQLLKPPPGVLAPDPLADAGSRHDPESPGLAIVGRLYDEVAELAGPSDVRSEGRPLMLLVDDAQWSDEPSLRFLEHVALRIDELPVALMIAIRLGEPSSAGSLLEQISHGPHTTVLTPRTLSDGAVETVVREFLGDDAGSSLTAACARASGGNPFYLNELVRTLASDASLPSADAVSAVVPDAVLRGVMVRLGRLDHDCGVLAKALAVLGDATPLRLAARLAALDDEAAERAADELAEARIFAAGEPLSFAHPLIASALLGDIGGFERARAHRTAADLLIGEHAAAEQVAQHLLLARPASDVTVVPILAEAASRSVESGDPESAARLLGRALAEPPSEAQRADLVVELAKAEALSGSVDAPEHLESALALIDDATARADVLSELATLAHHQGDFARASELARRAGNELPRRKPGAERLIAIELAAATFDPDQQERRDRVLEPILAGARAGEPPTEPALLAIVVAELAVADPPELVRDLAERVIEDDPLIDRSYGGSVGWVGSALIWVDELELAERWLDAALAVAERRGAVLARATVSLQRAWVRYHRCRLDEAVSDSEQALEIYRFGWTSSPWSTPMLTCAHVARGHLDAAREAVGIGAEAGSARPEYSLLLEAESRLALAELDPSRALEKAKAAAQFAEGRYGHVQARVWEWRRLAALAAQRRGDLEEGRRLLAPDLETLREIGPARQLGAALTVAGQLAEGEEGLAILAEAAAVLEGSPSNLQRLETLLELGGALRRAGRRSDASEPLYEALELADRLEAKHFVARAREELGALGLRPRRAARSGLASLTPSERRVATLAAQGLTTPQITQTLQVTRNTVETHLSHVYRKLNVSGRTDLPEELVGPAEAR